MDWKNLKEKAVIWGNQATEIAKKGFETSKEYAEKTGDFTYAKLKESKFVLKNIEEYEKFHKEEKYYVIFCIQDGQSFTTFFLTMLPVLFTKVWIESGSLRIIVGEETDELRTHLAIKTLPSVLLKTHDGSIKKLETEEEIRALIKDFSFYS